MTVSRFRGRYWSVSGCFVGLISAVAVSSRAAEAAVAGEGRPAALLAPERSSAFGEAELTPLLEVLWKIGALPAGSLAPEAANVFAFREPARNLLGCESRQGEEPRLLRPEPTCPGDPQAPISTSVAVANPPALPSRFESPAPDSRAAAMESALTRLILGEGPANPLGEGDWSAARAAIGAYYADRKFEPVFVRESGLTETGRSVLRRLGRAAEDGLDIGAPLPRVSKPPLAPADMAAAEVAIAALIVVYAEQASGSRVSPLRVSRLITLAPAVADPGFALAEVAAAPDAAARLADFNPLQKGYRALRQELARLAEEASDRAPRAPASVDDGAPPTDAYATLDFRAVVETPEKRAKLLRRKSAYAPSANSARLRYLAQRRAAILANMEMWRWEPRDMGERRIEVNVPDFSASFIEGDTVVLQARVVVGKPNSPTPIFSNVMRYVLINPSWQVPDSIIRKEMLPRAAADPDYFIRHGYQVSTVGGRLTVRQPPGEDNALGRLAFMFPNDHSVYMHDTPSQRLFDAETRAFSHGCIRVEDPVRLAELVLGWPESRITAAFGRRERTVFLPHPLPIHIEYFTEFSNEFGELQERGDVYGIARRVADTLSKTRQD